MSISYEKPEVIVPHNHWKIQGKKKQEAKILKYIYQNRVNKLRGIRKATKLTVNTKY